MSKIHLDTCNITKLEKKYVTNAINKSYVSKYGDYTQQFTQQFQKLTNATYALATNSGTSALHLALMDANIDHDDEVITTTTTFGATAHAIEYTGATPILIDINPDTLNIDHTQITKQITPHTKAIIVVHLYGNPCNMDAIMAIAKRHSLIVIEDATEAIGSYYKNQHVGTIGDYGCFSFNGNKTITTGQGGMLTSNKHNLRWATTIAAQAQQSPYTYVATGYNYTMPQLNAALGCAQLERIQYLFERKQKIHDIYRKHIKELLQEPEPSSLFLPWMNVVKINVDNVDEVITMLMDKKIPTKRTFKPLHLSEYYDDGADYPNADETYNTTLCLPSSTLCTDKQIKYVCDKLEYILDYVF